MEYLIGTGGWTYFKVPNKPSLKAYSENFNFVEVNSTFYKYPSIRMVEAWRRTVPSNFTFTVRCHQDLTHKIGLKPNDEAHMVFNQMVTVCRALDAPVLHLLTPAGYAFDDNAVEQARAFLSTTNHKGIRLAWETRSLMTTKLARLVHDFDIIHSVDLSKEEVSYYADTVYTRVFGKGKHNIYQFTDEELDEVNQKILKSEARMAIITFHGLRMNTDAARFKKYIESGTFIPVTAYTGIKSAKAVLEEDAQFPATKAQLIEHQGWKVVDLNEQQRIHLSKLLRRIPEKTYRNTQEVTRELEKIL